MSEPKLLKNTCPQCGGKLRIRKGEFFTFSYCQQCKSRKASIRISPASKQHLISLEQHFKQMDVFVAKVRAGEKVECVPYHGQEVAMREPRGAE